MVVYEAFASGKPVVGTRMGGVPELIRDGHDGLVVPAGDRAALRGALARLAAAPAMAADMGRRAHEKVLAVYDFGRHVDRLLEIYDGARRGTAATERIAAPPALATPASASAPEPLAAAASPVGEAVTIP